ncbi:hypothetical protein AB6846_27720 [Serratia proteamaculans]
MAALAASPWSDAVRNRGAVNRRCERKEKYDSQMSSLKQDLKAILGKDEE